MQMAKMCIGKIAEMALFPPSLLPLPIPPLCTKIHIETDKYECHCQCQCQESEKRENVNATSTRNGKTTAPHRNSNFAYVFPLQLHYWCLRIVRAHFFFCSLISLWHRFIWRYALWRNCGTSTTIFSLLKLNVYPDCTNNLLHTQLR